MRVAMGEQHENDYYGNSYKNGCEICKQDLKSWEGGDSNAVRLTQFPPVKYADRNAHLNNYN